MSMKRQLVCRAPTRVWMVIFTIVPLLLVLLLRIHHPRRAPLPLENFTKSFGPVYLPVLLDSLPAGALSARCCAC